MIARLLYAVIGATGLSIVLSLILFSIFYFIVHTLKYNYGNENYWVFSYTFVFSIFVWIISFGIFCSFIE